MNSNDSDALLNSEVPDDASIEAKLESGQTCSKEQDVKPVNDKKASIVSEVAAVAYGQHHIQTPSLIKHKRPGFLGRLHKDLD